jgi:hypothetical protein
MTQSKSKSVRVTKEIIAQREEHREIILTVGFYVKDLAEAEDVLASVDINKQSLPPLYQSKPKIRNTYKAHKKQGFTYNRESYQYCAEKETWILQRNERIPDKEFVLHFNTEFLPKDINQHRKKIFRTLRKYGLETFVNIELTRTIPRIGKPNNRVHFHFLTDDRRSEKELRALFKKACRDSGLGEKEFCIDYKEITDGYWYFYYFTKYDRNSKDFFEEYKRMVDEFLAKHDRTSKEFSEEYNRAIKEFFAEYDRRNRENGENTAPDKDNAGNKNWSWRTVLLFQTGTGLQKFYEIGWFKKPKGELWEEIKAEANRKKSLALAKAVLARAKAKAEQN